MASSQPLAATLQQPSFADLGRRLAAYFLDLLVTMSIALIAGFALRVLRTIGLWMPVAQGQKLDPLVIYRGLGWGARLSIVLSYFLWLGLFYLPLFESSPWQASFGKRLLAIYVTNNEGKRIGVSRAFGRCLAKWVFNFGWLWLISIITIAGTKKKKALHDFVASTLVVRGRPAQGGSLEPWRIVAAFGIPFVWTVGAFLATLKLPTSH